MLSSAQIAAATNRAAEVLRDSGAKERIEKDGYTRINPFRVAEFADVLVMLRPMDKLLGAFIRQEQSGILLNSERPAGLVQMTCAHELGHFFLNHGTTADDRLDYAPTAGRQELEADWFAYSLIAPRWAIARIMRRKNWSRNHLCHPFYLYQLSLRLGISYKAAAWSLNRLKLLERTEVDTLLRTQPATIKKSLLHSPLENPHRDVWLIDEADQDLILEPRVDDQMLVRLRNHSSAGYVWTADEAMSEGFLIEPLLIPPGQRADKDSTIGGGVSVQDYLITQAPLAKPEPAQLNLSERKPWSPDSGAIANYSTQASFEHLDPGLSPAAKESLLRSANQS
ncbi:hypothetical protein A9179_21310 [Pseudomonas alcaligenes]|uniref:IrrE N-terminal-like domain-containing protein n=1 Tax=Aquipseudomonas alcaligenes TaxID=43263 RepID=A0ABR7S876_AQUAC|nr:ImmA/IrrE family metallo-endopeptidase [Pseudomonas alcaligenes]MBC9252811.1 hypothetical protein [Pseudomonas alcaligenes]